MTRTIHTIGEDIPLSKAIEMMREYQVRHLPVQVAAHLVGVLSDRDIKLALTVHASAKDLVVGDIMSENVYMVPGETPLEEVAMQMATHKYGCAVVTNDQGKALGIFTAIDGLKVLSEILHRRDHQP